MNAIIVLALLISTWCIYWEETARNTRVHCCGY